jgi:parallel beta-helix repeat protein
LAPKDEFSILLLTALLLTSSFLLCLNTAKAAASPRIITVPDDFSSIEAAINYASAGDTVFVRAGIYRLSDSIAIKKSISLIGEDPAVTVIKNGGIEYGAGFTLRAANVTIVNFTFESFSCVIDIQQPNCTVANNKLVNGGEGIFVTYSPNFTIKNNDISGYSNWGISLLGPGVNYGKIIGNTLHGNGQPTVGYGGILAFGSKNTTIANNTLFGNAVGLSVTFGGDLDVLGNNFTKNERGIVFGNDTGNMLIHRNTFSKNNIGLFVGFYQRSNAAVMPDNFVYGNFFLDNLQQANLTEIAHPIWDHEKIGNYWSDYQTKYPNASEISNSGVGNTPYTINALNVDHYPLIKQAIPERLTIPEVLYFPIAVLITFGILVLMAVFIKNKSNIAKNRHNTG